MPHGKPKSDDERRKTHKMVYGNSNIPKNRKRKNLKDYKQATLKLSKR